jgi:serine/threonine-protein kinase
VSFEHLPPQVEETSQSERFVAAKTQTGMPGEATGNLQGGNSSRSEPATGNGSKSEIRSSKSEIATNWSSLFTAAGLDLRNFKSTNSRWVPSMYADERAAWEGPHPDHPAVSVRIEAAAYQNRPVHFQMIFPWDRPGRQEEEQLTWGQRAAAIILATLFFVVLVGAAFVGRRNLQLGRSDKKGAFRLALFIFLVVETGLLIGARHVPVLGSELELMFVITSIALFPSALIWLLYIALEPHVRRRWPRLIISWTRLMGGGFRDPMVGRDLLIGGLLGIGRASAISFGILLSYWFGHHAPPVPSVRPESLTSVRGLLSVFLSEHVVFSVLAGLAFLFLLLFLYIILRKQWLAATAFGLIALAVELLAFASLGPRLFWIASILIATLIAIVLTRFGLLAMIANQLFFFLSVMYPMTTDFSVWYIQSFLFPLIIMLALAGYAFYISLGGRKVSKAHS